MGGVDESCLGLVDQIVFSYQWGKQWEAHWNID